MKNKLYWFRKYNKAAYYAGLVEYIDFVGYLAGYTMEE